MKKIDVNIPLLLIGVCIGSFATYFLMKGIISQEFSGLEAAGNASYVGLRNEILNDFALVPIIYILPFTLFAGVGMAISGWRTNRGGSKNTKK